MSEPFFDVAGHDLGRPERVVKVTSTDDVHRAIEAARAAGLPVVPVGLRATYWGNLSLDGAVVLDLTGFDRVLATEPRDGYATVESGIGLRTLDQHLRAHGSHLAMHPDAAGDTVLASSFANGCTAGIGMLWGPFADQVLGLEAIRGDGTTLQVGASRTVRGRAGPFAHGIPDLRSFLFGAEGAAAIVTEVDVALVPTPWEARVTWDSSDDRFGDVVEAALRWRRRQCVETLRWVWTERRGELRLHVASRVSDGELRQRIEAVVASLRSWPHPRVEMATEAERAGRLPDYERRWSGPPGSTWRDAQERPFAGIDALVPFGRCVEAYTWARAMALSAPHERRVAAYVGGDGVNLGVHCSFPDAGARDRGRAELEARLPELSAFDAVPYRPGVAWTAASRDGWHAATVTAMRSIADVLDPERRVPGSGLLRRPTDGVAR